jgi:hypothetical protein
VVCLVESPDGPAYAVLSREHRSRRADGGWDEGRVLYLHLVLGKTFDRDAEDFAARFTVMAEA